MKELRGERRIESFKICNLILCAFKTIAPCKTLKQNTNENKKQPSKTILQNCEVVRFTIR